MEHNSAFEQTSQIDLLKMPRNRGGKNIAIPDRNLALLLYISIKYWEKALFLDISHSIDSMFWVKEARCSSNEEAFVLAKGLSGSFPNK